MKLCKELMYSTFHHFNSMLFDGKLPTPKICYLKDRDYQAYFIGYYADEPCYKIKINFKHYNKTYQEFCESLIHEMVHLYQMINGFKVNHGKSFKHIAKVIKRNTGMRIR